MDARVVGRLVGRTWNGQRQAHEIDSELSELKINQQRYIGSPEIDTIVSNYHLKGFVFLQEECGGISFSFPHLAWASARPEQTKQPNEQQPFHSSAAVYSN